VPIEQVVVKWVIQSSADENLFVLPCGTLTSNPYELLDTERMRDVLAECERRYDLVILDSPPLMAVTDPILLGSEVDGVCLVIKSGRTREDTALMAKKLLEGSQTNIIGTILNDIDTRRVNGYEVGKYYVS
jgi:Mrp family chromosome partitioning ATPase